MPPLRDYLTVREDTSMDRSIARTATDIGQLVRQTRIALGLTQEQLAMAAGTGFRFVGDLERGKPTCQLAKTLSMLSALGIGLELTSPVTTTSPTRLRRRV